MSENLPLGWTLASLGEIAKWGAGGTPNRSNKNYYGGEIPWVKTGDLGPRKLKEASETITHEGLKNSSAKIFPRGSIVIAMYGATIGKTSILDIDAATNQACAVAIPLKDINRDFTYHLLNNEKENFIKKGKGGAQPNISQAILKEHKVLLPPANEQIRIANKLDSLLAKVDTAQTRLEKIPTLLKRFRQAVLIAATNGELTKEWRERNSGLNNEEIKFYELWNSEYQKSGRKFKHQDIIPSSNTIDDLPESWMSTRLGFVCDVFVGATPSRKENSYWNGDVNWVSSSEVAFCRIKSTKETITKQGLKNTSTNIHPAGTVMLAMIGQGKTRGQAAILDIEACHNQNTAALRVLPDYLLSEYLYFFLWSQYEKTRKIGGGNNQQALNKSTVQGMAFPYPPIVEQREIVRRVESLFSQADIVEKQYSEAKKRIDRLTQSLLAKAFRGELVPQDPNDGPASELLKRIQTERENKTEAKPKRIIKAKKK